MNGFRKGSYLANPTGFRASPLSLNPILAGKQNTNFNALALPDYVSYADLQAQKAAAEAAAVAAAQADNGNDSYGGIGNDYWNDQYQGDGGGWDNEGPGDFDSGGGWGSDFGGETDDPMGWSTGGTIPPMYAAKGNYIDNLLGLPDNRTAFDTTTGLVKDNIKDIGGTITTTAQDLYNTSADFVNKQTTPTAIKDTVFNALVTAGLKSNPYTAPLATLKTAYDIIQTVNNYSKNQADQTEALDPSVEMESLEALPSELGAGITNPADFNFKDSNYGYTPAKVDTNRRSTPATNFTADLEAAMAEINNEIASTTPSTTPSPTVASTAATYNSKDFVGVPTISNIEPVNPGPQTDFDAQLEAAISAELGDYTNSMETSTPSASPSMSDHAAVHGIGSADDASGGSVSGPSGSGGYGGSSGGYGDDGPGGGYGDGDSDSGSGQDGANSGGMGGGMGGGNDSFRSAGGRIYASQGGYVNSVGGK